jgi:hypothetical protein
MTIRIIYRSARCGCQSFRPSAARIRKDALLCLLGVHPHLCITLRNGKRDQALALLRNAVDHGLNAEQIATTATKPAVLAIGTITDTDSILPGPVHVTHGFIAPHLAPDMEKDSDLKSLLGV